MFKVTSAWQVQKYPRAPGNKRSSARHSLMIRQFGISLALARQIRKPYWSDVNACRELIKRGRHDLVKESQPSSHHRPTAEELGEISESISNNRVIKIKDSEGFGGLPLTGSLRIAALREIIHHHTRVQNIPITRNFRVNIVQICTYARRHAPTTCKSILAGRRKRAISKRNKLASSCGKHFAGHSRPVPRSLSNREACLDSSSGRQKYNSRARNAQRSVIACRVTRRGVTKPPADGRLYRWQLRRHALCIFAVRAAVRALATRSSHWKRDGVVTNPERTEIASTPSASISYRDA